MSTSYSLLFYLKKPKNYVSGPKPIYMRITVGGIPKEVSTERECDPAKWISKANRAKGTKEDVKTLNSYLDTVEHKVADIHLQMTKKGEDITSESIKLKYLGKDIKRKTLLAVLLEHNGQMEALLGKGFKPNTLKGYKTSLSHIEQYLKTEHECSDIDVRKMDHGFVTGHEFFLRSALACYPRRIPKTPFAAHRASKVGLCPTSACSCDSMIFREGFIWRFVILRFPKEEPIRLHQHYNLHQLSSLIILVIPIIRNDVLQFQDKTKPNK